MKKLWGDTPYNFIKILPIDHNTGTGLNDVTEILYTIWNDRKLNERSDKLIQRIEKGLTPSKSTIRAGKLVEENLLRGLVRDAITEFNKDKDPEDKIDSYKMSYIEFNRLYNIPSKGVVYDLNECEEKIGEVPTPVRKPNVTIEYCDQDQCSTYKMYGIKGELSYKINDTIDRNKIYKLFPYLGKLYGGYGNKGYFQLYVYDYKDSNNAMYNVINYLVDNHLVTLK